MLRMSSRLTVVVLAIWLAAAPAVTLAADSAEGPYWGSLRASEVNMRTGPGEDYRINWVYKRQHLPVKVLREMGGWRLIEDVEGARGWVILRFVSKEHTGLITAKPAAEMRESAGGSGRLLWRLSAGVVGKLGACSDGWCPFEVDGHKGYVAQAAVWGAGAP